ncbi:spore germination protein GerPC [Paenibacillus chartarius]|uniref:Spore germination protein GerPC n=1 Tax=Paenibacillus chartarius TaxID=747481 RepID=A0ABV6DG46_9BACL
MSGSEETSWPEYFRKLQAYMKWQTERILELQRTVSGLSSELTAVKEQKGVRIDKIEYNFDQLKVERLEGTLNIGVTPGGLQSIEEFAVNGQSAPLGAQPGPEHGSGPSPQDQSESGSNSRSAADQAGGWIAEIGRQVASYLDEDIARDLQRWVKERQLPLDADAQKLVLDDIRAQLDDRIRHYAKENGNRAAAGVTLDSIARDIIERTKRDIHTAITTYVTGFQPAEEGEHE